MYVHRCSLVVIWLEGSSLWHSKILGLIARQVSEVGIK